MDIGGDSSISENGRVTVGIEKYIGTAFVHMQVTPPPPPHPSPLKMKIWREDSRVLYNPSLDMY